MTFNGKVDILPSADVALEHFADDFQCFLGDLLSEFVALADE